MRVSGKGILAMGWASKRLFLAVVCLLGWGLVAQAQYYQRPESQIDPSLFKIDEKKYLGAKLDAETPIITERGEERPLGDFFGKPLILVFSYYTCDGSCSVINNELLNLLVDVKRVKAGEDFRILTLSFDANDNLKTAAAFREKLGLEERYRDSWVLATFKNEADLKAQTAKVGFKFFWSRLDRTFLHPGAFLFLSSEGRLVRVLYPQNASARDVELAVLDAKQGKFRMNEIINFAVSLCFSYNYQEGKYTYNIPVFVGFGALFTGIISFTVAIIVFRRRRRREQAGKLGEIKNEQMA